MRSCGSALAAVLTAGALLVCAHAAAQTGGSAQAAALYKEAVARETALRKEMTSPAAAATPPVTGSMSLQQRMRTLVGTYEDLARLFPASGYSDNALWQGAVLAGDAFTHFGDGADRATALRLFEALTARFPTSSRLKEVPARVERLKSPAARADSPRPEPVSPSLVPAPPRSPAAPAPPPAVASTSSRTAPTSLTAIRRDVLPEALRITLELEREVAFYHERIDGPPRIFVDLPNTRAVAALKDAVLPFADDVVKQVRVGRQLNSRIRVVLDLSQAAGRHSVYTVYDPYRVVIDVERGTAIAPRPAEPPRPADPAPPVPTPPTVSEARPAIDEPRASSAGAVPAARTTTPPPAIAAAPPPLPSAPAPAIAPPSANTSGGFSLSRQLGLGVARIVIDPGHGGHDPGAKVDGLSESQLVLDVALRLEKLLAAQIGVEVLLTRRTNTYVPLEERTAIANRSGADLFLSLHANASTNTTARGIETYFLNFATNPEAEKIAARENAGSVRTMRELPDIVQAIALNNKIDESRDFATTVQATLFERLRRANRNLRNLGVKQAPFMVLIGATMPSILAEISFLTNSEEAKLLKTEKYRQQIAEALLAGVMKYQQALKRGMVATK